MRKDVLAPLIVLLMLVAIGGSVIMNSEMTEPNDADDSDGTDEGNNLNGDDWNVYYVDSNSDLPDCDSVTQGRLYYVSSTSGFEACTFVGWTSVDLTGPEGQMGSAGVDGTNGTNGIDGVDGTNGTNGVDGTDGQDGDEINMSYIATLEARITNLESDLVNATSCQLVPWGNCANADLSNMDMSGMDLTGINLRGANLTNANLSFAELNESLLMNIDGKYLDLSNTYLIHADLSYAFLREADLTDAFFWNTDLSHVFLKWADLTNARCLDDCNLANANLGYANLTNANLWGSDLTNAEFIGADLTDASISSSELMFADFGGATVTGATFNSFWYQTAWTDGIKYDSNQA